MSGDARVTREHDVTLGFGSPARLARLAGLGFRLYSFSVSFSLIHERC